MHTKTSEIKTEYCFFKNVERIVFIVLGAVEMMRFALNSGIYIIKIAQKSGNPVPDLFHFGGNGMRCITPSSEECIFQSVGQSFQTML